MTTINDMPTASAARLETLASIQTAADNFYCETVIPLIKSCIKLEMFACQLIVGEPYINRIEKLLIDKGYRVSVCKASAEPIAVSGKCKLVIEWKKSH